MNNDKLKQDLWDMLILFSEEPSEVEEMDKFETYTAKAFANELEALILKLQSETREKTLEEVINIVRPNWSDHNNYRQNVEAGVKSDILSELQELLKEKD